MRSILFPYDYLTYRLTGRTVTDRGEAWGTGYFDPSGRAVLVPDTDEPFATGAAVQAAAVLTGRPVDPVQAAWGLGGGNRIESDGSVDAAAVRGTYARPRG